VHLGDVLHPLMLLNGVVSEISQVRDHIQCILKTLIYMQIKSGYDSLKGGHAFDPEGIVSSLTAVVAPIFGAHCGAASVLITDHRERLKHWGVLGLGISVLGLVIHAVGLPLNTDLYSLSYLLLSTGVAVMVLCLCYYLVDYLPSLQTDNRRTVHPLLKPFHWYEYIGVYNMY
jgi:predicted acyltransferase